MPYVDLNLMSEKAKSLYSKANPVEYQKLVDKAAAESAQPIEQVQQTQDSQQPSQQIPQPSSAPYTSIEDQAKAMLEQERVDKRVNEEKIFGTALTAKSQKEETELFLQKQQEQKSALELQIERMNKNDQAQFDIGKNEAYSAVDANKAQFAQNREGVMSTGNQMISKEFESKTNKKINIAQTQLDMAFTQRESLKKELDEAQKMGQIEHAEDIRTQLAGAENRIRQEQLRMQELASAARTEAFDFMEKAPAGALAGMDPAAVAQSFGIDTMTAGLLVQMDTKKQALEARQFEMDEMEYYDKMLDYEIKLETAKYAGMSPDMKQFMEYKSMLEYDPQSAEEFANFTGIKEKSFFADFQEEYSVQAEQRQTIYKEIGVKVPLRSKYAYDISPDGGISFERSAPAGMRPVRGQCGAWVNDVLNGGPGLVNNSYASKKALVNSQDPVAGSAFIENVNTEWGHIGIVEKVYRDENGEITGYDVRESNFKEDERITTGHIKKGDRRWNRMAGYFVPGENRARTEMVRTGEEEIVTPGSVTRSTGNAMLDRFAQDLANGKTSISDLKAAGFSKSDLQMVMTAAAGQQKQVDTSNYATYAEAYAKGDMSISDLKALGVPEEYLGRIAAVGYQNKDRFAPLPPSSSVDPVELSILSSQLANKEVSVSDLKSMGYNDQQIKAIQLQSSQAKQSGGASNLSKEQADNYVQLKNQYRSRPEVGEFKAVQSAYAKIKSVGDTAAGDLSMIFNYMKMLDPGSVVREGEFANAQNAAGVPDRIKNQYNKIRSGKRLGEKQKAEFIKEAENLYKSNQAIYKKVEQEFRNDAKIIGLPSDINYTLGDFQFGTSQKPQQKTLGGAISGFLSNLGGGGKQQPDPWELAEDEFGDVNFSF